MALRINYSVISILVSSICFTNHCCRSNKILSSANEYLSQLRANFPSTMNSRYEESQTLSPIEFGKSVSQSNSKIKFPPQSQPNNFIQASQLQLSNIVNSDDFIFLKNTRGIIWEPYPYSGAFQHLQQPIILHSQGRNDDSQFVDQVQRYVTTKHPTPSILNTFPSYLQQKLINKPPPAATVHGTLHEANEGQRHNYFHQTSKDETEFDRFKTSIFKFRNSNDGRRSFNDKPNATPRILEKMYYDGIHSRREIDRLLHGIKGAKELSQLVVHRLTQPNRPKALLTGNINNPEFFDAGSSKTQAYQTAVGGKCITYDSPGNDGKIVTKYFIY